MAYTTDTHSRNYRRVQHYICRPHYHSRYGSSGKTLLSFYARPIAVADIMGRNCHHDLFLSELLFAVYYTDSGCPVINDTSRQTRPAIFRALSMDGFLLERVRRPGKDQE